MPQYVPSVTDDDVDRIVRRDYPAELHNAIQRLIQAVEVREKPRVVRALCSGSSACRRTRRSA
jgi:hypothetical protein